MSDFDFDAINASNAANLAKVRRRQSMILFPPTRCFNIGVFGWDTDDADDACAFTKDWTFVQWNAYRQGESCYDDDSPFGSWFTSAANQ